MTMALLSQAAIHQMRQRLGQPFSQWDATHLARDIFGALEGDVRVKDDTILVTYYNAPQLHIKSACANITKICPINSDKRASSLHCLGSTASNSTSASDSHPRYS